MRLRLYSFFFETAMPSPTRGTGSLDEQKAWDKYFDYLVKSLHDPDAGARARSAKLLGEHRDPQAAPALTALLMDDPDMGVRDSAATALGQLGAVEPLIQALHIPDAHVRQLVTQALGQIRDARAVEPLIGALRDTHGEVRQQVAFALTKIGAAAVEPLVAALRHPDAFIRWSVIRVLGTIGDRRALPELDRLAREDQAEVLLGSLSDDGRTTRPQGTVALAARQTAEKIRRGPAHTGPLKGG
ncbi:MAG: HEAT repeat domain-containing protein [Anaerolineales bacterium]|nr:HEAT repeat domain-containing protein [Anaerolineales bacterium]